MFFFFKKLCIYWCYFYASKIAFHYTYVRYKHSIMVIVCDIYSGVESHRVIVLCILYHISIDEKSRSMFAYTDCLPQVRTATYDSAKKRLPYLI